MTTYTDVFTGSTIYPSELSYRAVTLSANVTLSWPLDADSGTDLVAKIMDVTASGAYVITMPDATMVSTGETVLFNNVGATTFTVADNSGTTILTIAAGQQWQLYLTSNSTAAGSWRTYQMGATTSSATAATLVGYGIKAISTSLNQKMDVSGKSSSYTIADSDRAKLINWTGGVGTLTLTAAATLGTDWFCQVRNSGVGAFTLSGSVDGGASKTFNPGDAAFVCCDGTSFYTVGFGQDATFAFDYTAISVAGGSDYTLTGSELNRIAYNFTGALTANINIIVPTTVQQYWVNNTTTGGFNLYIKTAAQVTPVLLDNAERVICFCDGANVNNAVTAAITGTVSGGSF